MSVFYDLSKTPRNILNQAIVRAIISENNGALFDPSDLSTLYQDAAGTIPVTAVEWPVGKMLDKSGNGYHATQSITASRPTLSARYNLLTKTEDFSDAAWVKDLSGTGAAPVVTTNYATAPDGSNTAARIVYALNGGSTTSDFSRITQSSAADLAANTNTTLGVWLKSTDGTTKKIVISMAGEVRKLVDVGNNWLFVAHTMFRADTNYSVRIGLRGMFGTSDSADILIWHPDLRLSTTSGPYQRVNTATDYDTDERYFKKFLRFDGVDDYLNLPYMGLYAGGSASAIFCMDDRTQAGNSRVFSEASATTSSQYSLRNLTSGGFDSYITDDTGASFVDSLNTKGIESKNYIVSVIDSGSNITRYRNSAYENVQHYSRAGKSFTANKTTIGALDTMNTVVAYTAMNLYGLIITKSAITDSQRVACERYLGRKSGV